MALPLKVFITGASSGLGEALAKHYAANGATLGLVARRAEELARVARSIAPARIETYAADVRDADAMIAAGADFVAKHGVPDVVIANAGISRGTMIDHAEDLAAFREVLDTNVAGLFNTFHPFVAPMRAAGRGTLAGIASIAGFRGLPGSAGYSASKAAAIKVLEALRVELAPAGIAVVTICPGYVATPMTARNPYAMPFLMDPDRAAASIVRAIARRKRFHVLPWPMAIVGRVLAVLPRPIYDRAFAKAPRKPRQP
jgi:hypothetical protein